MEEERAYFASNPVDSLSGFMANFATRVWPDKIKFCEVMLEEIRVKGETRLNQYRDYERLNKLYEDIDRLADELGIRGDINEIVAKRNDDGYRGGVDGMWREHNVALKKLFIALRNLGYEIREIVS